MSVSFSRDKKDPKVWNVKGPVAEMAENPVTVTRADGTTTEVYVERLSKTFIVEGVEWAYGYLAASK